MPQRVRVCARVFTTLWVSVRISCVYMHVFNLYMCSTFVCARLSVRQKGGPLLGLCQCREDERTHVTSLQRGKFFNSTIISILHPTSTAWAYKWFLSKTAVYLQNIDWDGIESSCHCTSYHNVHYAYVRQLEGNIIFSEMWLFSCYS